MSEDKVVRLVAVREIKKSDFVKKTQGAERCYPVKNPLEAKGLVGVALHYARKGESVDIQFTGVVPLDVLHCEFSEG